MELPLTPEQESQLRRLAAHLGKDPGQMVIEAALRMIEDDSRIRVGVRKGLEQASRGEFVDEAEMDARLERMLQR
jgi:predicted transcriptional regulator